jgi:AraC-like DNA-binding protein
MKADRGGRVPNGSYEPQLVVNEFVLSPGSEWSPQFSGWLLIHVSSGVGYWLYPHLNRELQPGALVLVSDQVQGALRASQVSELRFQYFRIDPPKLTGLVTLADQEVIQDAATDSKLSLRVLPPNPQFSEAMRALSLEKRRNTFPARVRLLQLFLEVFGGIFQPPSADATGVFDARDRLRQLLDQMPVSELLQLDFSELVSKTRCSPRHVSRLFTELVGVSFREKQVELRLARARELLATTQSKVVEVALESGYQSTSLFSATFKQRFGVSPAKWREQREGKGCPPPERASRRLRFAA